MNKTATLLLAGVIAALAIVPAIGYGESRVYVPPKDSKSQLGYRDISGLNWREISKHYAPAKSIEDWRKLHSERHWKKGYSAYQIAHAWENANPKLPREIAALFYGPVELLAAIPEHKTPLPGGRAPSQSDLLVFVRIKNRVCAVTVEGKKDEGFGTTVGEWSKNASAGKIKRLKHIAAKLGLAYPPAGEIRYQLLHRTAAAVIEAGRFNADCAATLVHSFSPQHESFGDFATFLSAFGIRSAKRDKIYKTTKPGIDLYLGWASPPGTVAVTETPAPQPKPAAPAPAKPENQQVARVAETAVVTETAAPSPETVAIAPAKSAAQQHERQPETATPVPSPQPAQTQTTAFIVGGIVALALIVGLVALLMWRHFRLNTEKTDKSDTVSAADEGEKDSSDKPGKVFEKYVEGLLCNRENVKLTKPTNKFDYPDFEMTIRDEKCRIFLECKWTNSLYQGHYDVIRNPKQLQKYKDYQREYEQPFFIVLGVGGTEDNPDYLYTISLNKLPQTKLNFEQLKDHLQKPGGYCGYSPSNDTLTISR